MPEYLTVAGRPPAPGHARPASTGAVLFSQVLGFGLQRLLTGGPDPATYLAGMRALLA